MRVYAALRFVSPCKGQITGGVHPCRHADWWGRPAWQAYRAAYVVEFHVPPQLPVQFFSLFWQQVLSAGPWYT